MHGQLRALIPDAPITAILAGDIAFKREDYPSANTFYRSVWELKPSNQVAGKIYRVLQTQTGESSAKVLEFLEGLCKRGKIVGIDLCEVAPDYDPGGTTAFLAAQLLLNVLGFMFDEA